MQSEFETIAGRLKEIGIVVDSQTFRENSHQGFMSTVYVVDSDQGELVVHLIRPASEWVKQRIWEKLRGVGTMLLQHPGLPVSPVFLSDQVGERYFLVQKRLSGKPAGKRGISDTAVIDTWDAESADALVPQIQKLLAEVHTLSCNGYGMPIVREEVLRGRYDSWEEFFKSELPRWLASMEYGDAHSSNPVEGSGSRQAAAAYVQEFLTHIPETKPCLVHGDAINPSNILVQEGNITGLIDWEWSSFGDPAWEFCDPGWWPFVSVEALQPYFAEARKYGLVDEVEFVRRINLYIPLWLMWGCQLHSENPNGMIYQVLRRILANVLKVPS